MSAEFLITSLAVIFLPGTGVIYTLAWGLGRGWQASILAAFGCTLGITPHIATSIAGLAALLHASPILFQGIKYLGAAYLLYMAWMVLRDDGPLQVSAQKAETPALNIILSGFLINILNPKLSLFFLAFLPQFVPPVDGSPTRTMLFLAAIFMLLTFVVFVGYGYFAALVRSRIISKPHVLVWFRRGFAIAFGILALRLALAKL
jgi:threonine/homoserine/homoserine lactone efflux protein